jgi:predicted RNA binding protein YcfA (HicA-like mRNA interferase family)
LKVKTIIEAIESDGWYLVRTRGSHRQYKHPTKSGLVTIAGKLSEDLASGTTNSILKQAKLKVQKIIEPEPDPETIDEDNLEELN